MVLDEDTYFTYSFEDWKIENKVFSEDIKALLWNSKKEIPIKYLDENLQRIDNIQELSFKNKNKYLSYLKDWIFKIENKKRYRELSNEEIEDIIFDSPVNLTLKYSYYKGLFGNLIILSLVVGN